jgi:hypothetical protein
MNQPRVTDNDSGEITVALDGRELRGWSYANDGERRQKMLQAREYVEGWCDAKGSPDVAATPSEPAAWVAWHPEKGYAPQTCGHDEQHAASLLMRTGIAGEHGWSVRPLYPDAAQCGREPSDGGTND